MRAAAIWTREVATWTPQVAMPERLVMRQLVMRLVMLRVILA